MLHVLHCGTWKYSLMYRHIEVWSRLVYINTFIIFSPKAKTLYPTLQIQKKNSVQEIMLKIIIIKFGLEVLSCLNYSGGTVFLDFRFCISKFLYSDLKSLGSIVGMEYTRASLHVSMDMHYLWCWSFLLGIR